MRNKYMYTHTDLLRTARRTPGPGDSPGLGPGGGAASMVPGV